MLLLLLFLFKNLIRSSGGVGHTASRTRGVLADSRRVPAGSGAVYI